MNNAGFVGRFPSIAMDREGYPVINYLDDDNGDLKLVSLNPFPYHQFLPLTRR